MPKYKKIRYCFSILYYFVLLFLLEGCTLSPSPKQGTNNAVWSTYFSNNDSLYSVGYNDGKLELYLSSNNRLLNTFHHSSAGITTCLFSRNDSLLLTSSMDSLVCIYDVAKQKLIKQNKLNRQVYTAMFLNKCTNYAECGSDSCIYFIDLTTGKDLFSLKHDANVNFFWFTKNDSILYSSCQDGYIYIWDFFKQKIIRKLYGHKGGVNCVYINSVESLLVSTGADSTVKVWDLKEGVKLMTLKGHKNVVQVAMFNKNANYIASSDEGGYVIIWDLKRKKQQYSFSAHDASICALHFNSLGSKLITGSLDGSFKIWLSSELEIKQ